MDNRTEVGEFLVTRRATVTPEQAGSRPPDPAAPRQPAHPD